MRTLKLTLAYDGTAYVGWQRQLNGTSVQQCIEDAFVPLVGDAGIGRGVAGASRTDAGVHAEGQVASFECELGLDTGAVQRALNIRLPPDIRVLAVDEAPARFHARFDATAKSYRYRVVTADVLSPFERAFVWHAPGHYDIDAMQAAAASLVGQRDFASFQARGTSLLDTIRLLSSVEVSATANGFAIDVEGAGFLRHMVRIIAGTLAEVGFGSRTVESVGQALVARDRRRAGPTAPAAGLTLLVVHYGPRSGT